MPETATEQWQIESLGENKFRIYNNSGVQYIWPDEIIPPEIYAIIYEQLTELLGDGITGDDVIDYEDAIDDEEVADDTRKKSIGKQRPSWTILDFGDKSGSGPASGSREPLGPQESYRRMPTDFLERMAKEFDAMGHKGATNWAALELAQRGIPGYAQYEQPVEYQDAPKESPYDSTEDYAKPEPVVEDRPAPQGLWGVSGEARGIRDATQLGPEFGVKYDKGSMDGFDMNDVRNRAKRLLYMNLKQTGMM